MRDFLNGSMAGFAFSLAMSLAAPGLTLSAAVAQPALVAPAVPAATR